MELERSRTAMTGRKANDADLGSIQRQVFGISCAQCLRRRSTSVQILRTLVPCEGFESTAGCYPLLAAGLAH